MATALLPHYVINVHVHIVKRAIAFALCLLLSNTFCCAQPAISNSVVLSAENVIRIGAVQAENGRNIGRCFYCDERGYVATCMSNLFECKDAYVQFSPKIRLRVAGFVGASRGMDVVILQLLDIPKEEQHFRNALEMRGDYSPQIGDLLLPVQERTVSATNIPKLLRVVRGDEYCLGFERLDPSGLGCHGDTCWLWLNQSSEPWAIGAPVFNRTGQVVAMMSAGPGRRGQTMSALHIQHVLDLIPKDDPKAKPIKQLQVWADPVPSGESNRPDSRLTEELANRMGGDVEAGDALASRYASLLARMERAAAEKSEVEQSISALQERNLELLAKMNDLQGRVAAVVPEEAYTEKDRDKDKDGKDRDRIVTNFRYSRRQIETLAPLRQQIETVRQQTAENSERFSYETTKRLPFLNQAIEHLESQTFFRADPLGLRSSAEHAEFDAYLTTLIEQGGAQAPVYLARGMMRIHLKRYKDAMLDLKEAYDIDTKHRAQCRALNARIVALEGSPEKSESTLKGLFRDNKNNPRFLTLLARCEMDQKNMGSAARYLQQAHAELPHDVELQVGLAWLLSQGNNNSKFALEVARSAAIRTGYRDWNSLAALANVHMMTRKRDLALETIQAAVALAPPAVSQQCSLWQKEIENDKPIKRN